MAIFKKLFIGDSVATGSGKCFKKLSAEEPAQVLAAGLYDAEDNLVADWDTLVNTYGMDVEKDYGGTDYTTDRANPSYIFTNKLVSGTKLVIANGITHIGANTFALCSNLNDHPLGLCSNLSSITIPEGVTSFGRGAFYNFGKFTSINIPASLTSIGENAFALDRITEVHLTDIWAWCGVDVPSSQANPLSCAGAVYINGERLTALIIPDGVVTIQSAAFYNCPNLTSLIIPDSVTYIGSFAFATTSLGQAVIGNGVASIPDYMFYGCGNFHKVAIPTSVTSIGNYAFNCGGNSVNVYYAGTEEQWADVSVGDYNNITIHYNSPGLPVPPVLSGVWIMNGYENLVLSDVDIYQDVIYTIDGVLYDIVWYTKSSSYDTIRFYKKQDDTTNPYAVTLYSDEATGWKKFELDFGDTPQIVDKDFYSWFTANATKSA